VWSAQVTYFSCWTLSLRTCVWVFQRTKMYLITVAYDENTIRIRCPDTNRLLASLDTDSRTIGQAFASPDSSKVAAACGKVLKLWELGSNLLIMSSERTSEIVSLCFNKSSDRLALGEKRGFISVVDVDKQTFICSFHAVIGSFPTMAFTMNSDYIVSCDDDEAKIEVYDSSSGRSQQAIKTPPDRIWCIAVSPVRNDIAIGTADSNIHIISAITTTKDDNCKPVTLRGHRACVCSLAYNSEGSKLASGGQDCYLRIWDVEACAQISAIRCGGPVLTACFNWDGTRIAYTSTFNLYIYDTEKEERVRVLMHEGRGFYSAATLVLM
jgi:WD40 repeat protein